MSLYAFYEMSHEKVWSCRSEADNEELFFMLCRFLLESFAIVLQKLLSFCVGDPFRGFVQSG